MTYVKGLGNDQLMNPPLLGQIPKFYHILFLIASLTPPSPLVVHMIFEWPLMGFKVYIILFKINNNIWKDNIDMEI